jgi:hypothetical protein
MIQKSSLAPCTHNIFLEVAIYCIGIAIYNNAPKMWASRPFSEWEKKKLFEGYRSHILF